MEKSQLLKLARGSLLPDSQKSIFVSLTLVFDLIQHSFSFHHAIPLPGWATPAKPQHRKDASTVQ
jgi:hypothetical protein